jgi:hypothetical protein
MRKAEFLLSPAFNPGLPDNLIKHYTDMRTHLLDYVSPQQTT